MNERIKEWNREEVSVQLYTVNPNCTRNSKKTEMQLYFKAVWQGSIDHELRTEKWQEAGKEYCRYWHEYGTLSQGQNNTYKVKVKNLVCPLECNLSQIIWYKLYEVIYIYGNAQIFFT